MTHPIVSFAADVLSFPLWPGQAEIIDAIYTDDVRTAILRCGRRAGKGRIAAVAATYEATVNAPAHLAAVPPDEQVAIVVISRSQRLARVVHRYIAAFLGSPGLGARIVKQSQDEIELDSGVVILTVPCHAAGARGMAVAVAICDEMAWWAGSDGSPLDPAEVLSGIEPATAQFAAGKMLILSTPRWAVGAFADLVARAESGRFPGMRAWHRSTREMNPRITDRWLASKEAEDPIAYRREYLAEFEAAISAALDPISVRAAVRDGDPPARDGEPYYLATDPAATGDRWTLLGGWRSREGTIVVDFTRSWRGTRGSPVRIDATLDEIAEVARAHGAPVVTDQWSSAAIQQGLEKRGIRVLLRPWTSETKVSALTHLRRYLYAAHLSLPDEPGLTAELLNLEVTALPSGRARVAAAGGGHDDWAAACLALCAELAPEFAPATGGYVAPRRFAERITAADRPAWPGLRSRFRPTDADKMDRAREAASAGIRRITDG